MHLNRLSLRNFKKYRRAEIEFQDGLTGIIGSNGSGKSTVVEAIAWALYGNRASMIKREYIKNAQAGESDSVEVRLSFNLGKQEFLVKRSMKGKSMSSDASLDINGQKVAAGSREVDQRLEEILKISYQDFMRTFYARQKDLDNLLKEGGTGKKEYLLKLLNLDEIREAAVDQVKSDSRSLEDEKFRLSGALSEIGSLESKIEESSKKISSAKFGLADARSHESELTAQVEKRRLELDIQLEKRRSHDLLSERISRLQGSIGEKSASARAEESRLKEIDRLKAALLEMEPGLIRLKAVVFRLEELDPKKKEHERVIQRRIRIAAELDGALKVQKDNHLRLSVLLKERSAKEELSHQESEYQALNARLSELEVVRDKHAEIQTELKGEKIRLSSSEENIARTESSIQDLRSARARIEEINPRVEEHRQLQAEFEESIKERDKKKEFDSLLDRKKVLDARRQKLLGQISSLQKDVSALGDLDKRESDLRVQDMWLDQLGSDLNSKISDLNAELGVLESGKREAERNLARVEELGSESTCPTCERPLGEQHALLVQKYEQVRSDAEAKILALNDEVKEYTDKIEGAISSRSRLKRSFEDLNSHKRKRAELQAEGRSLLAQAGDLAAEIGSMDSAISTLGQVKYDHWHFAEIQAAVEKLAPYVDEVKVLSARAEDLPKKEAELKSLMAERQRIVVRAKSLEDEIASLGYAESEYVEKRRRLAELKPYHEKFSRLSERMKEIPALEERIKAQASEIDNLAGAKSNLEGRIKDLGFDPSEYENLTAEKKSLAMIEVSAAEIRHKISLEPEIRGRLQEAVKALEDLLKDLERSTQEMEALGYREEIHRATKLALGDAEKALDAARKDVSNRLVLLGVLEGEMKRLLEDKKRSQEIEMELSAISHRLQVVDATKGLINRFMDQVLVRIRNDIATEAGKILEEVTGKYDSLMIDDSFNILVEDGGDFYPIWRYSGGEVDMIAVSVRIAISEYLMRFRGDGQGYSFMILDEVFGSQDLEHREKMISMLRKLDDRFPQIFAISHISDVQGQFDNTINVVEDEMGYSRIEAS